MDKKPINDTSTRSLLCKGKGHYAKHGRTRGDHTFECLELRNHVAVQAEMVQEESDQNI